jgi:hypothetical protein
MPAILERCVTDVKGRLLTKAAKKRGISVSELSKETKDKAESSAYAICTSQLKKAGKM